MKIRLFGGEPSLPPSQSDEVVVLDSQLPEADEVVATIDEANTQKSMRRKRATQDESSLKKRAKKLKSVEDDPPSLASPEAAVASTPSLCQVPTLSRPPPPPILSFSRRSPVVLECILNASIIHQRRHFQEVSNFILFLPPSYPRRALGVARSNVGMADLVIADISNNLHVHNVSNPSYSLPSWNALDTDFLGELFDFADEIMLHDGALLLFHADDNGDLKKSIQNHFAAFEFTIFKEWLGVNRLRLSSPTHKDMTTNLFQVVLLVCATKTIGSDLDKRPRHSSLEVGNVIVTTSVLIDFLFD